RSSISRQLQLPAAGDGEGQGPGPPLGGGAPRRLLLLPRSPRPPGLHQIRARRGKPPPPSLFLLLVSCSLGSRRAGIHVLPLAHRTTPPARASARTPRPHGRGRFVRSPNPPRVAGAVDPGQVQLELAAGIALRGADPE